jgi:vacuolar-type H+-ATPase subunit C/Vma6
MYKQLKHDILAIEHEIQATKEFQAKLEKWDVSNISNISQGDITDPFVGYKRQIIITIEDDPSSIQDELHLAAKYPDNTTIVHMDKNGNYI